MSIVSHLHHFFHAETCQSYIHTLRWKDRPLQCPQCQSSTSAPGARTIPCQDERYWCKERGCKPPSPTSRDAPRTPAGARDALDPRDLSLCLACSSRRIARELGVHGRTGYRWCWWLPMRPCPTRCGASWPGPLKRMTSITPPATRGRPRRAGQKRWAAAPWPSEETRARAGAYARIGRPSSPGSSPGGRRDPRDPGFYGEDGAEGRRPRHASRQ